MPQYERYEGESQEAADARIAKNKKDAEEQRHLQNYARNRKESAADRDMGYAYASEIGSDIDSQKQNRGRSINAAMKVIDKKRVEQYNRENNPEWAEKGVRQERGEFTGGGRQEKSYSTMLREEGHDVYRNQFNTILDNMSEDTNIGEIIGWEDGRYQIGLYAVRTEEGLKFVGGDTDRWTGYGKRGNPNFKTKSAAKYASAKKQVDSGKFLSYEDAYRIYKKQAKPGIAERVMNSISNYMSDDE